MMFGLMTFMKGCQMQVLLDTLCLKSGTKTSTGCQWFFEYDSKEGYEKCQEIIAEDIGGKRREELSKFVFKVQNNRGVVLTEFVA
jgi:hypothetical protein